MNIALILSGGIGIRLGADIPKQYIEVCGRPVFSYCLEQLMVYANIDVVQIVADQIWQRYIMQHLSKLPYNEKFMGFSAPGKTRQHSILNGLSDIRKYAEDLDYVLIHDAVRPFVSHSLIASCIEAVKDHDGVLPVLPMKDTLYGSADGEHINTLLRREEIFAGQAPEVFMLGKYYEANRVLLPDRILEINGSTEPAVMAGMDIVMIPGDEKNIKITTAADLERFREIVQKNG